MSDRKTEPRNADDEGVGRLEALIDAWNSVDRGFTDRVRLVSQSFFESRLRPEAAAKLLETTVAELEAVLHLAAMDDDDLGLLDSFAPPKTTWFSLSSVSGDVIRRALDAVRQLPEGESPAMAVQAAIEAAKPSVQTRVAALSGDVISRMATKAKDYGLLNPTARNFMASAARTLRRGDRLSPRQTAWLSELLSELAARGAVKRDSPDDDQSDCDAVLDALG